MPTASVRSSTRYSPGGDLPIHGDWGRAVRERAGPDPEASEALRLRRALLEPWSEQARLVMEHPKVSAEMKDLVRHQEMLGLPSDPQHAGDEAVTSALDAIQWIVDSRDDSPRGKEHSERLSRAEIVMLNEETPLASSEACSDGSYLIRTSGSLMSLYQMVAETTIARVEADRSPERGAAIESGIAAMRFHLLNSLVMGQSIVVGSAPRAIGRSQQARETLNRLATDAFRFAMAHETGHVALGHLDEAAVLPGFDREEVSGGAVAPLPTEVLHAHELDADHFSSGVVAFPAGGEGGSATAFARSVAIALPLLINEARDRAFFVRAPDTHPPFDRRLAALRGTGAVVSEAVEVIDVVRETLRAASDLSAHLPVSWWDALSRSSQWRTDLRPDHEWTWARQLDQHLGNPAVVRAQVVSFAADGGPDFRVLIDENQPVSEALLALGVTAAGEICDPGRPLGRRTLIRAFARCTAWDFVPSEHPAASPAIRRLLNFVAAQVAELRLRQEDAVHEPRQH